MNKFFHFWLTCPSCHEPHIDSASTKPLREFNGIIQCQNSDCRANFKPFLKLSRREYDHISKEIVKKGLPLFWEIIPNPIEQSYLNWIEKNNEIEGIHLITWPFDNVKFIPLLILEYKRNNPKTGPILVFSKKINKGDPHEGIKSPQHNVLYKCLGISDNADDSVFESKDHEYIMEKVKKMLVPKRVHIVHYTIDGEKKLLASPRKIKDEDLPEGAVPTFKHCPIAKSNINYNYEWMSFVLLNFNDMFCDQRDNIIEIFNNEDFPNEKISDDKVVFIRNASTTLPNVNILEEKVETPSLVIIDAVDYFFHVFRKTDFYDFLKKLDSSCCVLLFSTNPRLRYLHQDFIEHFSDYNVFFHCWDTKNRIKWLIDNQWKNDDDIFANPGSSLQDKLRWCNLHG